MSIYLSAVEAAKAIRDRHSMYSFGWWKFNTKLATAVREWRKFHTLTAVK